jgi:hypothetical protein
MATRIELFRRMSEALTVPLAEVRDVARREKLADTPSPSQAKGRQATMADAARLLVGIMVMRIEGAAARAKAVMADIDRMTRLRHGAQLYFDADLILPEDFIGAVGEILAALADPRRCERARDWIGRIGIARGAGRMAGWIEVHAAGEDQWEDFDYAASAEDMITIIAEAPMVRRIEVTMTALAEIGRALTPQSPPAKRVRQAAGAKR